MLLFLSRTLFPLPLSYSPFTGVLSLSLSLRMTNPLSLLPSIYSLRLVEYSWLPSSLTYVDGAWFDYSWQGICSIENNGNGLELVPTSKRLLGSYIPQDNTKLPRSWAALGKYSLRPIHKWSTWACLTYNQWKGHTIGLGLKNVLGVCTGQGPRRSGPKAVCRTII